MSREFIWIAFNKPREETKHKNSQKKLFGCNKKLINQTHTKLQLKQNIFFNIKNTKYIPMKKPQTYFLVLKKIIQFDVKLFVSNGKKENWERHFFSVSSGQSLVWFIRMHLNFHEDLFDFCIVRLGKLRETVK